LRIAALRAEREAIFALARERRVSDDIARRLARDIDLAEARYR
jgi:CPA1 family monovalent cation:H+ antiporter